MKAILTTRCGCTRKFGVPYPPNERIYIPLNQRECDQGWLELLPEDPRDATKTRTFKLTGQTGNNAFYEEE